MWVRGGDPENVSVSPKSCGTVACAAGYLPAVFPRSWTHEQGSHEPRLKKRALSDKDYTNIHQYMLEWFGLSLRQSAWLIHPSQYESCATRITPNDVADRIEEIIKREEHEKHFETIVKRIKSHMKDGVVFRRPTDPKGTFTTKLAFNVEAETKRLRKQEPDAIFAVDDIAAFVRASL